MNRAERANLSGCFSRLCPGGDLYGFLNHLSTLLESTVTLQPLSVFEQPGGLPLWGGWQTVASYEPPGSHAVEIRCVRTQSTCTRLIGTCRQSDWEVMLSGDAQGLRHLSAAGISTDY